MCPFLKIGLCGHKDDKKEFTIKAVDGNGFLPLYKDSVIEFTILHPESASLNIGVFDKVTNGASVVPKSKKGKLGVGIGGLVGMGLAATAVVATGGLAAPLAVAGLTVAGAAVVGGAAASSLQKSRLGRANIPVRCIREGYRAIALHNNHGDFFPLLDMLVHFQIVKK